MNAGECYGQMKCQYNSFVMNGLPPMHNTPILLGDCVSAYSPKRVGFAQLRSRIVLTKRLIPAMQGLGWRIA